MPFLVTADRETVLKQAKDAFAEIQATGYQGNLRGMYDVAPSAFSRLIEALVWLGEPVSQELQDLAGLRPIEEVL